jgi:ribonuclease Z
MEPIKLTFLGTGNAIPTKKRNHTAMLLTYKDENILVDCGEGTQRQFRIAELSPAKLTRILITHWHGDHVLGLAGLFQTLAMTEYNKTLKVYGPLGTKRFIEELDKMNKIEIQLEVHEISQGKFEENSEFYLEALPMTHNCPTLAYSFVIKDKLRLNKSKLKKFKIPNSPLLKDLANGKNISLNGKTIKASQVSYLEKGRKITFILDTKINDNAIKLAKSSTLLVCESSFSKHEAEQAKEYLHLTAEQAAQIAKSSKSEKLILTHISQRYEHIPKLILNEAKKVFKNSFLVNDFDVIEL